jgi:hypothetical protein
MRERKLRTKFSRISEMDRLNTGLSTIC